MEDKNVLAQRHPLYTANQEDWVFYNDSYIGGRRYTEGEALFPHFREAPQQYQDRRKRAYYVNFCAKVVDIYTAFVFKDEPSRTTDDPDLLEFFDNADRSGMSLTTLMRENATVNGLVFGHTVAVMDLPRLQVKPRSRLEDRLLGMRPYVTIYTPLDIVDWSMDREGKYVFIRVMEEAPDITDPMEKRPAKKGFRYRTWTRNEWMIHDSNGALLESGKHGLGVVPAVFVPLRRNLMYGAIGVSRLRDIAPLNRALFNYASLLDEQLYRQSFPILTIPVTEQLTKEKQKEIIKELGTNNGVFFDGKGTAPGFISPPMESASTLMTRMDTAAKEIIRLAKLQEKDGAGADKSGVAWRYEFHESNATFAQIAHSLEEAEEQLVDLFYRWQGVKAPEVSIEYPSDFNIRAMNEEIDETLSLLAMQISPTFDKELKRRMVDSALPSISSETKQSIFEEIDEEPDAQSVQREMLSLRSKIGNETITTALTPPGAVTPPIAPPGSEASPSAPSAEPDTCPCCDDPACDCGCACCSGDACECDCAGCADQQGVCACKCPCCKATPTPMKRGKQAQPEGDTAQD